MDLKPKPAMYHVLKAVGFDADKITEAIDTELPKYVALVKLFDERLLRMEELANANSAKLDQVLALLQQKSE
jgi:hypothetical protein